MLNLCITFDIPEYLVYQLSLVSSDKIYSKSVCRKVFLVGVSMCKVFERFLKITFLWYKRYPSCFACLVPERLGQFDTLAQLSYCVFVRWKCLPVSVTRNRFFSTPYILWVSKNLVFWSPLGVGYVDIFGVYLESPWNILKVETFVQVIRSCE